MHTKILLAAAFCASLFAGISANGAPGDSQVARWKDNKTAAFLLMFDDSCPSHYQVAIPELLKRGLIATFYVNPGKWRGDKRTIPGPWETTIPGSGMVYGDHTMTHTGVKDATHAEYEIGECQKEIAQIFYPDGKEHLISWGMPGVGPGAWNITKEELNMLLSKYHLIDRPPFNAKHGAVFGLKTSGEMLALADKAIAEKGMEYLIIHGVERRASEGDPAWSWQDFWALNKDILREVLDGVAARGDKGELWVTDHISQHKYQMERDDRPAIRIVKAAPRMLELQMTGTLPPALYDMPLTVLTEVPAGWKGAVVTQGTRRMAVEAANGLVKYDALPNGEPIVIAAADAPEAKGARPAGTGTAR